MIKLIYKKLMPNEYLFFIFRIHTKNKIKVREYFKLIQCDETTNIYELIELNNLKQFDENKSINKLKIIQNTVFDYLYSPNQNHIKSDYYYESRRLQIKE